MIDQGAQPGRLQRQCLSGVEGNVKARGNLAMAFVGGNGGASDGEVIRRIKACLSDIENAYILYSWPVVTHEVTNQ